MMAFFGSVCIFMGILPLLILFVRILVFIENWNRQWLKLKSEKVNSDTFWKKELSIIIILEK